MESRGRKDVYPHLTVDVWTGRSAANSALGAKAGSQAMHGGGVKSQLLAKQVRHWIWRRKTRISHDLYVYEFP